MATTEESIEMRTAQKGFTLAELLIALALLGIIAAFTIPKVLQAAGTTEATAKIRETVSTLEQAYYGRQMQNQLTVGATGTLYNNIVPTLNFTNASNTANVDAAGSPLNGVAGGHPCGGTSGFQSGWFQLPNGVVVTGLSSGATMSVTPAAAANTMLCIDFNGAANPNQAGQDIFVGNFNQWGDFDAAGAAFTPRDGQKAFFWGNANQGIYNANGTVMGGAVGTLGNAQSGAGIRLAS